MQNYGVVLSDNNSKSKINKSFFVAMSGANNIAWKTVALG